MAWTAHQALREHGAKLAVSLLLAVLLGWLLFSGGLPLVPSPDAFARVSPSAVMAFFALHAAAHWLKAFRWRHLLRPLAEVPTRVLLSVSWLSFAAILLAPLRAGEVVRPMLLARRTSARAWEVAGTVGAERVIDGLALSALLTASVELAPRLAVLPTRVGGLPIPAGAVRGAAWSMLALFVSAFGVMSLFFWRRELARRLVHSVFDRASRRLADRIAEVVERVAAGLRFLPSGRHVGPFVAETALFWSLHVLATWWLGLGCGLDGFTLAQAGVTLGCVGLGVLVPSGPGFFGVFQLSTYAALSMFFAEGVVTREGAAFVFLSYVLQVGLHLLAAVVGALLDRGRT